MNPKKFQKKEREIFSVFSVSATVLNMRLSHDDYVVLLNMVPNWFLSVIWITKIVSSSKLGYLGI